MNRAIICSYQEYSFYSMKILFDQNLINPVFWLVNDQIKKNILNNFKETITLNYLDAVRGNFLSINDKIKFTEFIDPSFILQNLNEEKILLNMMERNDSIFKCFTYKDRIKYYYQMTQNWSSVINSLQVDTVIFEEEPHQASDYILYIVAKSLKLKTIIPIRTMPNIGFIITDNLNDVSKQLKNAYDKKIEFINSNYKIKSKSINKHLSIIKGDFQTAIKFHLWDQFPVKKKIRLKSIYFISKKLLIRLFKIFRNIETDQVIQGKNFDQSQIIYLRYLFHKFKTLQKKKINKKYYEKISEKIDIKHIKYIFFGLQYQPEKSTCPIGGIFVDQILAISTIVKCLPENWLVVVKEHPSQFISSYARYGENYRDKNYYDQIKKLPNVIIVPMSSDTYDLIDNSQIVASVGGTLCWESVVRNKPSISFGEAWYSPCKGIYRVNDENDLSNAISDVLKKRSFVNEVNAFILTLEENCYKGAIGGENQLNHIGIDQKTNGFIHSIAIKSLLCKDQIN